MPKESERVAKTTRRYQYLGHLSEAEQRALAKFMGTGPIEAVNKLSSLKPEEEVSFRKSSLLAFHRYVSLLAGTDEDKPDKLWTKRKQLLDKAISYKLGQPG